MGKTLVVTSLVLAHKASQLKPVTDAAFKKLLALCSTVAGGDSKNLHAISTTPLSPPVALGCTVVIVNNTLVQQWADEIHKFAPGLKVHTYFASTAKKRAAMQGLRECDVLLTTPHMLGNGQGLSSVVLASMQVHRVVVDEAHLLASASMGTKLHSLLEIRSRPIRGLHPRRADLPATLPLTRPRPTSGQPRTCGW